MNTKNLSITVAALCGVLFIPGTVFAQEGSAVHKISEVKTLGSTEWQKTVDDAKEEIKNLLQENDKLTAEYDFLKEKLASLQSKVLETKQDVEERERGNKALKQFQKDQLDVRAKVKKDIEQAKKEVADIENEKEILMKNFKEEEKQTEVWQSKISDLQVKKRELTLELKLQEISRQELEQGQDEELDRLKKDLAKSQDEEKDLDKKLRSLRNEIKDVDPEADKIVVENKDLELKADRLKSQYEEQKRANEELEKKNEVLKAQAEQIPPDLVKEQDSLDAEIHKLEGELETVKKSIETSAELIQKKRQMMNEIMRMDEENQDLRSKIEELMKQADGS